MSGGVLARTIKAQSEASDPGRSAWVSANAGAGKTHVLKLRVLRLLLSGTKPDRVLCVTYTKAAAAEMQARVFAELADWATVSDEELRRKLTEVMSAAPGREEMDRARQLFALAIETPGGLKVQTIHGFCERLLQRFPLEAGVPPAFSILDDDTARDLCRECIDAVLLGATAHPDGPQGRALARVIAHAVDDRFDDVLAAAISRRSWLQWIEDLAVSDEDPFVAADAHYRRALGVRLDITADALRREMATLLSDTMLQHAATVLQASGKSTDADIAEGLNAARKASDLEGRIAGLKAGLLTKDKEPRSDNRFVTKAVRDKNPDIHPTLARARDRLADLGREAHALTLVEGTVAVARLAVEVARLYVARKIRSGALDYDDLIERTANLLSASEMTQWVLYKLDNGIDHILVDEAQDTSPSQWDVVASLANEFFAGEGASDRKRTLFAVGDEKQSIYSFQGAAPKMFAETGARFRRAAGSAGQPWSEVPLQLSFRTVETVLVAVDRVFADHARTPGVGGKDKRPEHLPFRDGHAGLVEVWPPETPDEVTPTAPFQPLEEQSARSPAVRLADRIADTIAGWIASGERLESMGRAVTAGDILILVRKRRPFAGPMVAALKARGIAVAGADRLSLIDEIAVKDLVALADFLVLPEDDLALACALKSPLLGLDDDDLLAVAPGRRGTLWKALIDAAPTSPRLAPAVEQLKRWRHDADLKPPYEFFAEVLDRCGGRERLLTRLGPDAADPIAEFLNLAITYDDKEPPSLVGFLAWLRAGSREIKRDMEHGRDEVRVMTVHGAKGLEAPIVFLPDTMAVAAPGRDPLLEIDIAGEDERPCVWRLTGASRVLALKQAETARKAAEREEADRLLYVALTRARDRLYIAGFHGKRDPGPECWYHIVRGALESRAETVRQGTRDVLRLAAPQTVPPEKPKQGHEAIPDPIDPPDWARRPAPREGQLSIPLAPSRLAPLEADEAGEPREPTALPANAPREAPAPSPLAASGDIRRFLRGTVTHALLQHVPGLPPERWQAAAIAFVEVRAAPLTQTVRAGIVAETLAVLRHPRFAAVFGPGSRAEVPLAAEIPRPGGGKPIKLTGQIDRLVRGEKEVLIVDYKTNRPPPRAVDAVPTAYLYQLAAYRLALAGVFGALPVRAALLWTDGPFLMPIPDDLLDAHEAKLWTLDPDELG